MVCLIFRVMSFHFFNRSYEVVLTRQVPSSIEYSTWKKLRLCAYYLYKSCLRMSRWFRKKSFVLFSTDILKQLQNYFRCFTNFICECFFCPLIIFTKNNPLGNSVISNSLKTNPLYNSTATVFTKVPLASKI